MQSNIPEISVTEFKALQEQNRAPVLIDVRRPEETAIATLGGTQIPLNELPDRLGELEDLRDQEIVLYCRSGARSGQATAFLQSMGFRNVRNLKGGILAWSREVDPSMPTY